MGSRPSPKKVDVRELKSRFDLREFAKTQGLTPERNSRHMFLTYSPFREERTPSFAVYSDHYFDYGSYQGGDIINLVMGLHDFSFREAVEYLGGDDFTQIRHNRPINHRKDKREKRTKFPVERLARYESRLDLVLPYMQQRGFTPETLTKWHIGGQRVNSSYRFTDGLTFRFQYNRVMIPYLLSNQVYGMNFRRDDLSIEQELKRCDISLEDIRFDIAERKGQALADVSNEAAMIAAFGPRYWKPTGTKDFIWGFDQLVEETETGPYYKRCNYVLVMEGELNAMMLNQVGLRAISVKALRSINIVNALRFCTLVYGLKDNDKDQYDPETRKTFNPGLNYVESLCKLWPEGNCNCRWITIPEEFKDPVEMAKKAGPYKLYRNFDRWGLI